MIYLWIAIALLLGLPAAGLAARALLRWAGGHIREEHQATSRITLRATPEQIFPGIANIRDPSRGWDHVELLPDRRGMPVARARKGSRSFIIIHTRSEPPSLLERTITDEHSAAGATWLFKIRPVQGGCDVRLTETARVPDPAERALLKYVFGYHRYTHHRLRALARELAQDARPHRA